jgi:hypothetical protein
MTTDPKDINPDRRSWYGLRVGDTVRIRLGPGKEVRAEVVGLTAMDKNRAYLRLPDGTETPWVAEWCTRLPTSPAADAYAQKMGYSGFPELLDVWRTPIDDEGDHRPVNFHLWKAFCDLVEGLEPDNGRLNRDGTRVVDTEVLARVERVSS